MGPDQRQGLKGAAMATTVKTLRNFIGGDRVEGTGD